METEEKIGHPKWTPLRHVGWEFTAHLKKDFCFFRTTPTSTRPSCVWWRTFCPWRRREPWATPQPKASGTAAFWCCLASTTTWRRGDSADVRDAPALNPETETTTERRRGRRRFISWLIYTAHSLPHSLPLSSQRLLRNSWSSAFIPRKDDLI